MKTESKLSPYTVWQIVLRHKFTLVNCPPVLVFGSDRNRAIAHCFSWFPSSHYEVVSTCQVAHKRFCAVCAFVYPDLSSVNFMEADYEYS